MGLYENRKSIFGGCIAEDIELYKDTSSEEMESEFSDLENLYKFEI